MANVIKHKRGSGSDPTASDLVVGEVAIRTDVGKLFTKTDSGTVSEIAGGGSDIVINTLSSSSATGGGSATFNGSAYRFTLSQPPSVSAQQLLVSIAGVIQKPVAGSGQPSEGFSVSGNDIILASAPATGTDFFILTFKSLGVSEPADNSVTSAKIVDGTIVGTDLATNIDLVDNQFLRIGNSQDLQIHHDGSNSFIKDTGIGDLLICANQMRIKNAANNETMAIFTENGRVQLWYDNSAKFETTSSGVSVTGGVNATALSTFSASGSALRLNDSSILRLGNDDADFFLYHDGSSTDYISAGTGKQLRLTTDDFIIKDANNTETLLSAAKDGAVKLYHDNIKKFQTTSTGFEAEGGQFVFYGNEGGASQLLIYADEGDDLNDRWRVMAGGSNDFVIGNLADASWDTNIKAFGDGAVELYYDNSKKFETTSAGIRSYGILHTDSYINIANGADLYLSDGGQAIFGNNSDLKIYHDGTHSYLVNNTGNLRIRNNGTLKTAQFEVDQVDFNDSANTVVHVRINSDGLRLPLDNDKIQLGASNDLQIFHDGTNNNISSVTAGKQLIMSSNSEVRLTGTKTRIMDENNSETCAVFVPDGNVQLYYDNEQKFSTESNGATTRNDNASNVYHRFTTNGGTARGYVYANSSNQIGFLDETGNWSVNFDRGSNCYLTGHWLPQANNTYDLGGSSYRWRNVYTNDLNLSNEGGKNDIDSTWGSFTIQEGAESLFLINRRNGKKYKFNLTEVA